jgi:hypothetical protein
MEKSRVEMGVEMARVHWSCIGVALELHEYDMLLLSLSGWWYGRGVATTAAAGHCCHHCAIAIAVATGGTVATVQSLLGPLQDNCWTVAN